MADELYDDVQGTAVDRSIGDERIREIDEGLFSCIPREDNGMIKTKCLMTYAQLKLKLVDDEDLEKFLYDEHIEEDELDDDRFRALAETFASKQNDAEDELEKAFNEMNTNKDDDENAKYIDRNEFRDFLMSRGKHPLTEEEIDSLFEEIDVNDDGKIDKDELKSLLTRPVQLEDVLNN